MIKQATQSRYTEQRIVFSKISLHCILQPSSIGISALKNYLIGEKLNVEVKKLQFFWSSNECIVNQLLLNLYKNFLDDFLVLSNHFQRINLSAQNSLHNKVLHSELEGSWSKPHQVLCWALGLNLVTRFMVTLRSKSVSKRGDWYQVCETAVII